MPKYYISKNLIFKYGNDPYWDVRNEDGRKVRAFRTKDEALAYINQVGGIHVA